MGCLRVAENLVLSQYGICTGRIWDFMRRVWDIMGRIWDFMTFPSFRCHVFSKISEPVENM